MSGIARVLIGIVKLPFLLLILPFRLAWYPIRLYRERISAQMIVSYVVVVLLTALIVQITAVAGGYLFMRWYFTEYEAPSARGMVEQARTISLMLAIELADPEQDGLTEERQILRLNELLSGVIAPVSSSELSIDDGNTDTIEFALVSDQSGRVIGSSTESWATPNTPITEARDPMVRSLTERSIELAGRPNDFGNLWLFDTANGSTVVSYPILTDEGDFLGTVTVQNTRNDPLAGLNLPDLIGPIAITLGVILCLLVIPAVFVSVPVGIWRARAFSRRLKTLSTAADAMATGDLSQRVQVRGHDELSRLSQRFNAMVSSLERSDQQRRAFVANISHELRTPVSIIQGNLERMLEESEVPTPVVESGAFPAARNSGEVDLQTLSLMHREVGTLSRLIDDLFTLARLEESALSVELAPVDLAAAADEAVESMKRVAWEQRKVTVQSMVPAQLPEVRGDRIRIGQILGNLLYNALRHTPEGGLIIVAAESKGDLVEVSVSDTGIGIPAEELELIFQRFRRSSTSRNVEDSTGLGLAIVKQLVEAQGGLISVESTPGSGTVFRFTLQQATVRVKEPR